MEPIKYSKNSWQYKLAGRFCGEKLEELNKWDELDTCNFRGLLIKSLLLMVLIYGGAGVALAGLGDMALALWFMTQIMHWPGILLATVLFVAAIIGMAVCMIGGLMWCVGWWNGTPRERSYIKDTYLSMKEKYCKQIKFD